VKAAADQPLPLAAGLTAKTNQLCLGLEDGVADIYDLVTPTTAELLRWWFLADYCATRPFNFHPGQRQAILNTIVAHEVLNAPDLVSLYRAAAPDALLEGKRLAEVAQAKHGHPKYCLKMATGTGKTWVMQALMIWSLLNKTAAQAEGIEDARFTRHFLIVAPGLIVYERLLDALLGKMRDGGRDFTTSDVARYGRSGRSGRTGNGSAGRAARSAAGDRCGAAADAGKIRRQRAGDAGSALCARRHSRLSGCAAGADGVQR